MPKLNLIYGFCYENDEGVSMVKLEANKWYKLAVSKGSLDAQNRIKLPEAT